MLALQFFKQPSGRVKVLDLLRHGLAHIAGAVLPLQIITIPRVAHAHEGLQETAL